MVYIIKGSVLFGKILCILIKIQAMMDTRILNSLRFKTRNERYYKHLHTLTYFKFNNRPQVKKKNYTPITYDPIKMTHHTN